MYHVTICDAGRPQILRHKHFVFSLYDLQCVEMEEFSLQKARAAEGLGGAIFRLFALRGQVERGSHSALLGADAAPGCCLPRAAET